MLAGVQLELYLRILRCGWPWPRSMQEEVIATTTAIKVTPIKNILNAYFETHYSNYSVSYVRKSTCQQNSLFHTFVFAQSVDFTKQNHGQYCVMLRELPSVSRTH